MSEVFGLRADLPAAPARVYRALTDGQESRRWLADHAEVSIPDEYYRGTRRADRAWSWRSPRPARPDRTRGTSPSSRGSASNVADCTNPIRSTPTRRDARAGSRRSARRPGAPARAPTRNTDPTPVTLVGPRTFEQYEAAMSAVDIKLTDEQLTCLDSAGA